LCGDMSLITNERACHARLREIQRVTVVITEERLPKNARHQRRALPLQVDRDQSGVGYAACKLPAASLPR